jgi:sugar O-acyltransferase (sialic acid O-acetyltransferase NeuD family)
VADRVISIVVLGTTPLAAEVADVCTVAGYEVAGFVEDVSPERALEPYAGLPVHWIDDAAALAESHLAISGVETGTRPVVVERATAIGFRFATVIHPGAYVPPTTTLGVGSVVGAGAVAAGHTEIGRHVLVERGSLLGHHTLVGDYSWLQAGASVAGSSRIGEGVRIGMGAIVIDHVTVGAGSVVAPGAVVVKDVPENVRVAGVPARIVGSSGSEA